MIYHLINANYVHQIPNLIKSVLDHADRTNSGGIDEHFFILCTHTNVSYSEKLSYIQGEYKSVFQQYNFINYTYVSDSIAQIIFLNKISKKDKLVIHDTSLLFGRTGFFWGYLFLKGKKYCSRVILMTWGVGAVKPKNEMSKFSYLLHIIKKRALQSFQNVITLTSEDEKKIKEQYNLTNVITSIYIHDAYKVFNDIVKNRNKNKVTRIMVSHSGWEQNNHIQTFKLLERFKDNNIEIVCPLCYGDDQYISVVKEEGEKIFGKKFISFKELLPLEEYYNFLSTINIFIANATVQTSLHVVFYGICTGLKMYLKDNNYDSLVIQGFKIHHISELDSVSFEDLCSPVSKDWLEENDKIARDYFSVQKRCEIWKTIYT